MLQIYGILGIWSIIGIATLIKYRYMRQTQSILSKIYIKWVLYLVGIITIALFLFLSPIMFYSHILVGGVSVKIVLIALMIGMVYIYLLLLSLLIKNLKI